MPSQAVSIIPISQPRKTQSGEQLLLDLPDGHCQRQYGGLMRPHAGMYVEKDEAPHYPHPKQPDLFKSRLALV